MAIATALPAFLDELRDQLLARGALADVDVFTGWVGDTQGRSSIQFLGATDETDWGLIGTRRIEETFTITGMIQTYARGAGETAIKAARDAAKAIFDELLAQLRTDPAVNSTVRVARVAGFELDQGFTTEQRTARIDFRVVAEVSLTP